MARTVRGAGNVAKKLFWEAIVKVIVYEIAIVKVPKEVNKLACT